MQEILMDDSDEDEEDGFVYGNELADCQTMSTELDFHDQQEEEESFSDVD